MDRVGFQVAVAVDPRVSAEIGVVEQFDTRPLGQPHKRVSDTSPRFRIVLDDRGSGSAVQIAVTIVTTVTLRGRVCSSW
jgi:hypothetical protein